MSAKSLIVCACGRRIEAREVLQHGYFMSRWRPVWVYLKYRCSRCRMMGEKLIDYHDWDESALGVESARREATDFAALGEIDEAEVREFGQRLGSLTSTDLDALARNLS